MKQVCITREYMVLFNVLYYFFRSKIQSDKVSFKIYNYRNVLSAMTLLDLSYHDVKVKAHSGEGVQTYNR